MKYVNGNPLIQNRNKHAVDLRVGWRLTGRLRHGQRHIARAYYR